MTLHDGSHDVGVCFNQLKHLSVLCSRKDRCFEEFSSFLPLLNLNLFIAYAQQKRNVTHQTRPMSVPFFALPPLIEGKSHRFSHQNASTNPIGAHGLGKCKTSAASDLRECGAPVLASDRRRQEPGHTQRHLFTQPAITFKKGCPVAWSCKRRGKKSFKESYETSPSWHRTRQATTSAILTLLISHLTDQSWHWH